MRQVSFRPLARNDARETATYLAVEASEAIAERFLTALQDLVNTLADMPGIGAPCAFRSPFLKDVRRFPVTGFENWLVFYRTSKDRIDIIRVLHGARDIESIFEQGERQL
jgi:toxin ParE1/3/4